MSPAGAASPAGRVGHGVALGALLGFLALELNLVALVSYNGDATFVVVAGAVLGGLAGLGRARLALAAADGILAAAWLLVAFGPVSAWMADGLPRRDPLRNADAVFVLGSRLQHDGDPTTEALTRLLSGISLVVRGNAPRLIVSEQPDSAPYAPVARLWISRFRSDAELLIVGPVRSTRDEAVLLGRLFRERGWHTLLVVTSPAHSRRACFALEHEGIDVVSAPSVETRYDLETLDRPGERLMAFGSLAHERVGLVVYRLRGWIR